MHSFISSIASFFLSPFNWVVVLIIFGLVVKKRLWRRISFVAALFLFILFGNQYLLNVYARDWQPAPVSVKGLPSYSCGIVAGGFASPDAEAHGYFNATSDRFIQILRLYETGKIKHIIVSGGNGKPDAHTFQEGAWVKSQLVQMSVPDSVISVEDKSSNTAENAENTKHILDSLQLPGPYLLVTSAYHMPRASLVFKNAGVNVVPFPCNYTDGRGRTEFGDFIPRPSVLMGWDTYLKETVGYWWYRVRG